MNEPADTGDGAGETGDGELIALAQTAPPAVDDDEDVIDAEIVESPVLPPSPYGTLPLPDYSEAGVPSLDYVRDKIEGRFATAIGSSELAQAAADREAAAKAAAQQRQALTAEEQRVAREQAAKDKLDEIRRSLRP